MEIFLHLPEVPPAGCPFGPEWEGTRPALMRFQYIKTLHTSAIQHVDAELLDDLRDEWVKVPLSYDNYEPPPNPKWFTLIADPNLQDWKETINTEFLQDLRNEDNYNAVLRLIMLTKQGHRGFMEGNKILFHLMKDSAANPRENPGRWILKSAEESLEALRDPQEWEKGPLGVVRSRRGWQDKGLGKGKSTSSTSSSSWDDWAPQGRDEPPWKGGKGSKGLR